MPIVIGSISQTCDLSTRFERLDNGLRLLNPVKEHQKWPWLAADSIIAMGDLCLDLGGHLAVTRGQRR